MSFMLKSFITSHLTCQGKFVLPFKKHEPNLLFSEPSWTLLTACEKTEDNHSSLKLSLLGLIGLTFFSTFKKIYMGIE